MNSRKTNKNILTAVLALVLLLSCAACIVSCNGDSEDTMYPEYTGGLWTLHPSDEDGPLDVEEGHIVADSNDNVIDAGIFTNPVSETEQAQGTETAANAGSDADPAESADPAVTTEHIISPYDGVHFFPSDEFDKSGYKPLKPVTTAVE